MKVLFLFLAALNVQAAPTHSLELEMTGPEYMQLLRNRSGAGPLEPVLQLGARNFKWLVHLNSFKKENEKLSFWSPETQKGIPISAPSLNNVSLVLEGFEKLKKEMPQAMREVLLEGKDFTDQVPLEESEYLNWGRKIDVVYSRGARWILQEPYLKAYAEGAVDDVRGYYFLSNIPNVSKKIEKWAELSAAEKVDYRSSLIGMCRNTPRTEEFCQKSIDTQIESAGTPLAFYKKYLPIGQKKWKSFFKIPEEGRRKDITWIEGVSPRALIPFRIPGDDQIQSFLQLNVEDEWKWKSWNLRLEFLQSQSDQVPHIKFVPGSTPHVSGLGGNVITMDANSPLSEYSVRWTIRHEFGHVLGFPDCYIEFYDTNAKAMVSYQLDLENLMCSRKGRLQETHYLEMERNYLTQ